MISAERFAKERSSYWSQRLPRLEGFVRALNLGVGRFSPPITSEVQSNRHAFVAELAFELFNFSVTSEESVLTQEEIAVATENTRLRMAVLEDAADETASPTLLEQREARKIARNLHEFLRERSPTKAVVSPRLSGCGLVDEASADLMLFRPSGQSESPFARERAHPEEILLYEIKTVQRPFRASDIRQLLTYGTLLAAEGKSPARLGIVNPRLGTFFESSTNALALDAGGVTADELFQQIIFDVSGAETSL